MKKLLSVVLTAAMVCSMAACGLKSPETTTAAATTAAATEAAKEEAKEETTKAAETEAASDAGSTSAAANDPQVTLVYAEVNPLDSIVGQTALAFQEKVEELSGGSIKIDLQPNGVFGAEGDVLDAMIGQSGTIDITRTAVASMTPYGTSKANLLTIPYTFTGSDHFWKFVDSDLATEILAEPEEMQLGIRGLFYGEEGFRNFFANKPLNSIEDLKGMKLRVSTDPVMVGTVEALGASATVVAFNELYSALQTGVVDGAEQPPINYKANAFHEVAPYMILDEHQAGIFEVVITDDAWNNKLTDAQRECVLEASKYASDYCRQISGDSQAKVLEELKAEGVTLVEVEDKSAWQDACKDVIASASADQAELYQKIVDLAN